MLIGIAEKILMRKWKTANARRVFTLKDCSPPGSCTSAVRKSSSAEAAPESKTDRFTTDAGRAPVPEEPEKSCSLSEFEGGLTGASQNHHAGGSGRPRLGGHLKPCKKATPGLISMAWPGSLEAPQYGHILLCVLVSRTCSNSKYANYQVHARMPTCSSHFIKYSLAKVWLKYALQNTDFQVCTSEFRKSILVYRERRKFEGSIFWFITGAWLAPKRRPFRDGILVAWQEKDPTMWKHCSGKGSGWNPMRNNASRRQTELWSSAQTRPRIVWICKRSRFELEKTHRTPEKAPRQTQEATSIELTPFWDELAMKNTQWFL